MALSHNPIFQRLVGGGFLERAFVNTVAWVQLMALSSHKDVAVVKLIRNARRQRQSLQTAYENYNVYALAKAQAQRPGEFAEVGVYQGVTAKLICEAKGDKRFNVFDTFEGLPESSSVDKRVHAARQYAVSLESVQKFLQGYSNVHFYKGLFPDSAATTPEAKYAFAHFDVDLYESTLSCLKYFYPRMNPGGIMLSHDYSILAGVKQAFQEFLADKPEPLIELPSTQCMVVKL